MNNSELSQAVFDRLDGTIPKSEIYDIIEIMCNDFKDKLINRESVFINNFGTIHAFHSKNKKLYIRLATHAGFKFLLKNKRKEFF